jgi:hypothetical protein
MRFTVASRLQYVEETEALVHRHRQGMERILLQLALSGDDGDGDGDGAAAVASTATATVTAAPAAAAPASPSSSFYRPLLDPALERSAMVPSAGAGAEVHLSASVTAAATFADHEATCRRLRGETSELRSELTLARLEQQAASELHRSKLLQHSTKTEAVVAQLACAKQRYASQRQGWDAEAATATALLRASWNAEVREARRVAKDAHACCVAAVAELNATRATAAASKRGGHAHRKAIRAAAAREQSLAAQVAALQAHRKELRTIADAALERMRAAEQDAAHASALAAQARDRDRFEGRGRRGRRRRRSAEALQDHEAEDAEVDDGSFSIFRSAFSSSSSSPPSRRSADGVIAALRAEIAALHAAAALRSEAGSSEAREQIKTLQIENHELLLRVDAMTINTAELREAVQRSEANATRTQLEEQLRDGAAAKEMSALQARLAAARKAAKDHDAALNAARLERDVAVAEAKSLAAQLEQAAVDHGATLTCVTDATRHHRQTIRDLQMNRAGTLAAPGRGGEEGK